MNRFYKLILSIGPGLFCIGYTVGTGSVTSMIKSGSQYGSQLLWVLVLSCFFSWALMEAFGRFVLVTGKTAIHSFKTELKYGKFIAILVVIGIVIGQWNSLSGIVGLTSNAIYEMFKLFIPGFSGDSYVAILLIAILMLAILYGIMIIGKYSVFEKILIFMVTIMAISFFISMFISMPPAGDIIIGLMPSIPNDKDGYLLVAAFVGTTMAAPTFVVRPLLLKGKGWGKDNLKMQNRDALTSAIVMFLISASIMITAMGAMYYKGLTINQVVDMVHTLEPIAGKFAVALFMTGVLCAGISSVFPILMVAPLLIADYKDGKLDTNSRLFRILTGIACVVGLSVPLMGANPIIAQIVTQIANVFILPVVIASIFYLINRKELMGIHRPGYFFNIVLFVAFIFSCIISYVGVLALLKL